MTWFPPSRPPSLPQVFAVVFDEFHYMNDPERGTVWEESVILSPPHILFVALSATIANVGQVLREGRRKGDVRRGRERGREEGGVRRGRARSEETMV